MIRGFRTDFVAVVSLDDRHGVCSQLSCRRRLSVAAFDPPTSSIPCPSAPGAPSHSPPPPPDHMGIAIRGKRTETKIAAKILS